jgi:glutaminase
MNPITLFRSLLRQDSPTILKSYIFEALAQRGIQYTDPRIQNCVAKLDSFSDVDPIDEGLFVACVQADVEMLGHLLLGDLVIPDFGYFKAVLTEIFEDLKENTAGNVATYIPQLAHVNPEYWGLSVCTVDGQQFAIGDSETPYCVQSTCKPVNYSLVLETLGVETVHRYIGREPSGRGFNELTLNHEGRPHNPMINSGAIMACSLIHPELPLEERLGVVLDTWQTLTGGCRPGFSLEVYLSEKRTADRNFALGYFMREKKAFPEGIDLHQVLDFYFQCCAIEMTCRTQAVVAGSLANGGVCPITGERVFSRSTAKDCLSLMYSCGMYDFSGEFAFTVGLPAKSSVSGALMVVVPGVCGITVWSPRLDRYGNSERGLDFCNRLVKAFGFHMYDRLLKPNGAVG